jgi:hypothetical protein
VLGGDALAAADLLQGLVDLVAGDAGRAEDLAGLPLELVVGEGEQEVLGGGVVVLEALGLGLGGVEQADQLVRDVDLGRAGDAGEGADGAGRLLKEGLWLDAELLQDGRDDAALL